MPSRKVIDSRFMKMAKEVATWSKCLSRHIGAVIVKDGIMISSGYNGAARGIPHCEWRDDKGVYHPQTKHQELVVGTENIVQDIYDFEPIYKCPRQRMGFKSGEGMQFCPAVHAEANSIVQAAKLGISTEGTTLYCYCNIPCPNCAKEIINAGIKRVVCLENKESWPDGTLSSAFMFKNGGVILDFLAEKDWTNE